MARSNQNMAQRAVELLAVQPNDRVLEVGFGPGVGIQVLSQSISSGWIAGIDPSEQMLMQAKTRNAGGIEAGKVDLRRGSVTHLPFDNALFDKALAINSMQLWGDAVSGLREIRRVLRPKGNIVLGFTHHSAQTRQGATKALAEAGFGDVRVSDPNGDFCVLATSLGCIDEEAVR